MCSLDSKSTVLLNTEVFEVLKERGGCSTDRYSRALPVEKQAAEYLSTVLALSRNVDEANVKCKAELSALQLGSAEVFQILNLRPRTMVEVYLIVEDLDNRLGDEADACAEKILDIVEAHYPEADDNSDEKPKETSC